MPMSQRIPRCIRQETTLHFLKYIFEVFKFGHTWTSDIQFT